jgi:hypothetical protein
VERVAEQARLMLQRFRGLGPVASAAVLGLHCGGYGVVDPLPPPPVQCTTLAMPFTSIVATASFGNAVDAGVTPVVVTLRGAPYRGLLGLRVDAVRVTSGTLLGQTSGSTPGPAPGNEFVITIAPDAGTMMFLLDVDLGCGDATTTKHYRVIYFAGGYPSVDEVPAS